ncbi:MAG: isoprenyl transferase [Rhizobiaceae bacterium]|nr:isoprenyl transferase [Rhizobiaceae bacterium]
MDVHQPPKHVAIIMDGNGRWAGARGLNRNKGHRAGVETLKSAIRTARKLGIDYLTVFSFSSENWSRPKSEINGLFSLLKIFIRKDLAELHQNNVRVRIIGKHDNVPGDILPLLEEAETLTASNTGQTLIIAFNYGSRDEIADAAKAVAAKVVNGELSLEDIDSELISNHLETADIPDPDLIIRTSGEKRLSNFLLWQSAYAEFVFVDCLWPDFDEVQFTLAIEEYYRRTRKFGGLVKETA